MKPRRMVLMNLFADREQTYGHGQGMRKERVRQMERVA